MTGRLITIGPRRGTLALRLRRRTIPLTGVLLAAAFLAAVGSLSLGTAEIGAGDIIGVLAGSAEARDSAFIVLELRLPRTGVAVLVGCGLAVSGAVMQAVARNPLAEPGILGINSGAALAAILVIVTFRDAPPGLLPAATFAGALATVAFIYLFAWRDGVQPLRLILVGIGISAFLGAFTTLISTFGDVRDVQRALIWLTGSLYGRTLGDLAVLAACLAVLVPLAALMIGQLDAIALGEDESAALGAAPERSRAILVLVATGLTAASVAAAGTIGFVGLIAPHLARRLAGPRHVDMLPVAALAGALTVLLADVVGRTIIAPVQLPAGLLTAILGGPYFMYLLWTRKSA